MENASKALIMAGGMLLAILVTSLLIYAWNIYSEYQSSHDSLSEIEDTAKFNSQFTNYERDDVLGYELLSLINKVIDYNEKKTVDTINGNNDNYPYIKMEIVFGDDETRQKLTYNNKNQLFTKKLYEESDLTSKNIQSNTRPSFKKNIEEKINEIKGAITEDESKLTMLSKNIGSIFLTQNEIDDKANRNNPENVEDAIEKVKMDMIDRFNNCIGSRKLAYLEDDYQKLMLKPDKTSTKKVGRNTNGQLEDYYKYACAYYEYMQFKRGVFKCTKLELDEANSGRVKEISFEFTGRIH